VDKLGGCFLEMCIKIVLKLYQMRIENPELIHFRCPRILADLLNKESFTTGLSKQDVLRSIIKKHYSDQFGMDVMLEQERLRKTIEQNIK
jgi:hypothetical protein